VPSIVMQNGRLSTPELRILAVAETWQGANSYAFVRAFRRMGQSVAIVPEEWYVAIGWHSIPLKGS
jgi:spore maturation protein CgeB